MCCAKVTRLEITSKQSYGTFRPGEFVFWEGRIVGELRPTEKIPDIDKAPENADGLVEYSAKISLVFPKSQKSGNGTLLVDIPNRGRPYAQALYNSPRDEPFEAGTFEVGTGFLQDHGFSVAEVRWELGQGAELPSFTDTPGKSVLSKELDLPLSGTRLIFSCMRQPMRRVRKTLCTPP